MSKELRPFNLAQALQGKKVVTRDGSMMLSNHFEMQRDLPAGDNYNYPIAFVLEGQAVMNWTKYGMYLKGETHNLDLFMAE